MGPLFGWWFLIEILGLMALPLTLILLKQLPDKGYIFSKVLALLFVGYFSWLFSYASFGIGSILLSILLLVAVSLFLLKDSWISFKEFLSKNIGFILVIECFFLVAFLVAGAYKMRTPEIVGTEKPMDFAMINGILASPSMPPQDPWLSGGSISYYYFGYFIVAVLTKISGVASGEGYNLAVALTWALAAVCTFSIAYALTRRYRYSIFSTFCLAIFGNLDYWHRAIQSFQVGDIRIPYYNFPANPSAETGLPGFFSFLFSPLAHYWDYFQASRIVPVPPTDKLINEFPSFSFFLSDLHPHVMAIPFVLLAITVAFNLLKSPYPGLGVFSFRPIWQGIQWILLMVLFGGLSMLNSWDFPTLMLLLGVCLALQQWWANEKDFKQWLISTALVGIPVVIGSFLLYLPFYLKFQSQAKGLGFVQDRTDLYYVGIIFGSFLVVLIPALLGKAFPTESAEKNQKNKIKRVEEWQCVYCGRENSGKKFCGVCGGELAPAFGVEVTPFPHDKVRDALLRLRNLFVSEKDQWRAWAVLGTVIVLLTLLNLGSLKLGTLCFALFVLLIAIISLSIKYESREAVFATLLSMLAMCLLMGCEVLFVKDHFSTSSLYRMNTVFKFHYQLWMLLSISSGFFLKWLMENLWVKWPSWKKIVWIVVMSLVFLGAGLYPLLAFTARMRSSSIDNITIDGSLYYERTYPVDYQVALWIKQNVKPIGTKVPVILEAWGGSYHQEFGRIATVTGYPTILGWDFHEAQWRGSWNEAVIRGQDPTDTVQRRQADVDAIYTTQDLNQTKDLLKRYSVDYVYVGDLERQKYKDHPENLGKFAQLGTPAFSIGNSVLYKINP